MAENKVKEKKVKREKAGIKRVFDYDFRITREKIPKFLPFLLFFALLIVLYIANKYYAEKSYLNETRLKKEIKDLRAESLTSKAELISKTKESEVTQRAKSLGLEQLHEPPKKIQVKDDEY